MKKSQSQNKSQSNGSPAEEAFRKLFEDGLKDIYWVEKKLTKAIPKMIKNATSEELVEALEEHLDVTMEQVKGVEEVFEIIGKKPTAKRCLAMEGIIMEGEEGMQETEGMVRDAGIICSAQKVEHYEIASYGSLCAFANTLGMNDAADILKKILDEEKDADEKLSQIAESTVNMEALTAGEEGEEEEASARSGR
jgi:ferritin-like metal-binding protein YciE